MNLGDTINGQALDPTKFNYVVQIFDNGLNGEVASSPDKARLLKTAVYSVDADSVTTIPGISSGIDFVHYSGMGVINTSYTLGIKDVNGTYRVYDINLQHRTIKIPTNLENDILSGTAIRITKGEYDPNGTTIPGLDGAAEERTSSPFYTSYLTNSYLRRVFVTKDGKNILNRQLSTEVDFNVNWVLDLVTGQYSVATTNPVIDSSGDILSTVGSDEKEIPQIPGYKSYLVVDGVYTPATSIPADSVNIATQTLSTPEGLASLSKVVNIAYIADGQKLKFKAVDDDASGADITGKIGSTIATQMTGNSSAAVDLKQEQSDIDAIRRVLEAQNYEYVSNDDLIKNFDDDMSTDQELVIHFKHKQGNVVETKPVSRLINLHQPDGTTIKQEYQTGTATRTNTEDLVTGKVLTEGKWSGGLTQYQIPQLEGYISQVDNSGTRVDQSSIDGTSFKDSATVPTYDAIDVYYRNVPAYTVVNYKDADGNIIKSENIGGKVGDKVTVTADKIPDGYELVPGQDTSKEVTLTNDQPGQPKTPIVFNIQAKIVKVKHDAPKNAGDIIEKNFTYPQGVSEEDLNRSVTRTINVINPDGKTSTTSETVKFYRDATVNEVTGKVVYTDWQIASDSPQKSWSAFTTPNIKGYVPTITSLDAETPTAATGDKEYTITYTNQTYTTHVVFKDADGTVLRTQTITGVTGSTSNVDQTLPAGYKLKEGESIPSSITFNGDPVADKDITLEHDVVTLTDKTPDLPQGLTANDFKQDVSRTINVYDTTGQTITKTVNQTATFTRTATYDKATNKITFSNWQLADGSNKNFTAYTAPEIPGYTATTSVPAVTVDQTYGKQVVNIYYTPNDGKVIFKAYDQATGKDVAIDLDSLATNTELAGKVDSAVSATDASDREAKIKNLLDKLGYQYVENSATATPEKYTADTQTISLYFTHKTSETPEDKTVTRKINIPGENGKTIEVVQTATVHRTNTTDLVTGKTTPGDWSKASFPDYDAGQVDGHTTYVDGKETSTVPTAEVKIANGVPQNGDDVNVTYEANPGQQTIKYVDENGNPVKFSSDSDDQVITGKVGDIKTVNTTIPAGYELVPGETIPGAVDIKQSDSPIIVTLKAKTVTVTPDKPQNEGSEIPDNPGKTFPKGVSESDLNRTVTRKIIEDKPNGSVTVSDESVKFTRTATVNVATGKVTYSDWTVASPSNKFTEYVLGDGDQVWGYTASRSKVDESTPSVDAGDQEIHITYAKDTHTVTIDYVDSDNGDAIVHQTIVTGKTGETKTVTPEIPEGYELAKDSSVPGSVDFSKPASDQKVKLVHKTTTLTDETPDLPNGLTSRDLKHTVTRTINVYDTAGQNITHTEKQTAVATRTATMDPISKVVTYGDWTGGFKEFTAPVLPNYVSQVDGKDAESVPAIVFDKDHEPSDAKATIDYHTKPNTQTIKYINDRGEIVKTQTIDGYVGTTHEVTDATPTGYEVAKGFSVPGEVTIQPNDTPILIPVISKTVEVNHTDPKNPGDEIPNNPGKTFPDGVKETDLNRDVTRKIVEHKPSGDVTVQDQAVHFVRDATVNVATGEITYGEWKVEGERSHYDEYTLSLDDQVPGYIASRIKIDLSTPSADAGNQVIDVDYRPIQTIKFKAIDKSDNDQVIPLKNASLATLISGEGGDKIDDKQVYSYVQAIRSELEPRGYDFINYDNIPELIKEIKDGVINVYFKHQIVPVKPGEGKTPEEPVRPGDPESPKYPQGVENNDLTTPITRTINVKYPAGYSDGGSNAEHTETQTQVVQYKRTALVDKVTGKFLGYTDGEAIGTDTWSEYVPDVAKGYGLTKESEQAPEVHVKANDKDVVVNMEIVPLPQKLIVKAYDAGKKVVVEVPFNGVTYQNIDSETVKKTVDEALKEKGYTADWTSVEIPTRYDNDVDVDQIVELHTNLIPTPVTPENPKTNKGNKTPELPAKSTGKHDEPKTTTPLTPEANIPNKDVAKKITSSSTKLPQTGNDNSSAAGLGLAAMAVASLIGLAGKRKKDEKNK